MIANRHITAKDGESTKMEKPITEELESIIEQLADRLKGLERAVNRIEGQVADLYGRVR